MKTQKTRKSYEVESLEISGDAGMYINCKLQTSILLDIRDLLTQSQEKVRVEADYKITL